MKLSFLLRPTLPSNPDLEITVIRDEAAFEIESDRGGREWFIIEPSPALRVGPQYVAPGNPIAEKAVGLKAGAHITWEQGGGRRDWIITSVKHKWLHALHSAMNRFEWHFPGESGPERIEIDENKPEPFAEIFQRVKDRHDAIQHVLDTYEKENVPIHVPAGSLGSDIVEFRCGLIEAGREFRVCVGTTPERAAALRAIRENEKRGCIVDPLTLIFVRQLDLKEVVEGVCGAIAVTESTLDVLRRRVEERAVYESTSMTLYWKDGYYYRHEVTKEAREEALRTQQSDLSWLEENVDIVPAVGKDDPPEELRSINRAIGPGFMDDMLAAQGSSRLLLCEDAVYRAYAIQTLGVQASWLQPVLMAARDAGVLSRERYDEAVITFIEAGNEVVAVDGGVLVAASRLDGVRGRVRFKRVAGALGGPKAEMMSHLGVAADFLSVIWKDRPHEHATMAQTGEILENLLKNRFAEWRAVVAWLRGIFQERYGSNHLLDEYIRGWLQGHFIIPFTEKKLPRVP